MKQTNPSAVLFVVHIQGVYLAVTCSSERRRGTSSIGQLCQHQGSARGRAGAAGQKREVEDGKGQRSETPREKAWVGSRRVTSRWRDRQVSVITPASLPRLLPTSLGKHLFPIPPKTLFLSPCPLTFRTRSRPEACPFYISMPSEIDSTPRYHHSMQSKSSTW